MGRLFGYPVVMMAFLIAATLLAGCNGGTPALSTEPASSTPAGFAFLCDGQVSVTPCPWTYAAPGQASVNALALGRVGEGRWMLGIEQRAARNPYGVVAPDATDVVKDAYLTVLLDAEGQFVAAPLPDPHSDDDVDAARRHFMVFGGFGVLPDGRAVAVATEHTYGARQNGYNSEFFAGLWVSDGLAEWESVALPAVDRPALLSVTPSGEAWVTLATAAPKVYRPATAGILDGQWDGLLWEPPNARADPGYDGPSMSACRSTAPAVDLDGASLVSCYYSVYTPDAFAPGIGSSSVEGVDVALLAAPSPGQTRMAEGNENVTHLGRLEHDPVGDPCFASAAAATDDVVLVSMSSCQQPVLAVLHADSRNSVVDAVPLRDFLPAIPPNQALLVTDLQADPWGLFHVLVRGIPSYSSLAEPPLRTEALPVFHLVLNERLEILALDEFSGGLAMSGWGLPYTTGPQVFEPRPAMAFDAQGGVIAWADGPQVHVQRIVPT